MPKRIQRQRTKGWRMPEGAEAKGAHAMSLHHAVGAWDTEKARIATGLEDGAE